MYKDMKICIHDSLVIENFQEFKIVFRLFYEIYVFGDTFISTFKNRFHEAVK